MKKNLLLCLLLALTFSLQAAPKNWGNTNKPIEEWDKVETSLRSAQILDESFYDSIALPYTSLDINFDLAGVATMETLPVYGPFPTMGFKISLSERKPLAFIVSSEYITQFAFWVSRYSDLSDVVAIMGAGISDSIDAGVYYIAFFSNYEYGLMDVSISDTIAAPLVYQNISLPLDSININFNGAVDAPLKTIYDFGTFPAAGYQFMVTSDTTITTLFESGDIDQYLYSITNRNDSIFDYDMSNPDGPLSLTPGTYYLTIITNWQSGNYNLLMKEGNFDIISYTPISIPYNVTNALFDNTTVDVVTLEEGGAPDRILGLTFTLPSDTVLTIKFSSADFDSYDLILADTTDASSILEFVLDSVTTENLPAGDYYILLYVYGKFGNYDLSIEEFNDTIKPTASNPAPVTVNCISDVPAVNTIVVIDEADNYGIPAVTFVSDVSDGNTCPEIITRTYRVTDDFGNFIDVTQTITVDDTTNPTASNPAPVSVQCISDVPVTNIAAVTDEADNCTVAPVVAFVSDVSDGNTCPEIITRTYSVTDNCGNSINVIHIITVDDTTNPTASNPAPISVQYIGDVPAANVSDVTDEADNCSTPVVAFVSDVSDGNTNPEIITRTYSVTDDCGNTINVAQTITVTSVVEDELVNIEADIYALNKSIIVAGAKSGSTIKVYDVNGNIIIDKLSKMTIETLDIPITGVYVVTVNSQTKKILIK